MAVDFQLKYEARPRPPVMYLASLPSEKNAKYLDLLNAIDMM